MKLLNKGLVALTASLFYSTPAVSVEGHAGLDISLSDETGKIGAYSLRESEVEVTDIGAGVFFNEAKDNFLTVSGKVLRKGLGGSANLEAGVAGQVFYTSLGRSVNGAELAYGLMIGGEVRYWLPASVPLALSGSFLYSPKIVTAGDADDATETNIRAEMRILPSAMAYVGFREISVSYPKIDYELDKNMHIGIKVAIQ